MRLFSCLFLAMLATGAVSIETAAKSLVDVPTTILTTGNRHATPHRGGEFRQRGISPEHRFSGRGDRDPDRHGDFLSHRHFRGTDRHFDNDRRRYLDNHRHLRSGDRRYFGSDRSYFDERQFYPDRYPSWRGYLPGHATVCYRSGSMLICYGD